MFSNPCNVFLVRFSSCVKGFPFTLSAIICLLDLCHFTSSISFLFWNAIYILIWSNMLSLDIHCNYIDVLQWWRVKKNDLYTPNQNALFSFTKEWNWKHWKRWISAFWDRSGKMVLAQLSGKFKYFKNDFFGTCTNERSMKIMQIIEKFKRRTTKHVFGP